MQLHLQTTTHCLTICLPKDVIGTNVNTSQIIQIRPYRQSLVPPLSSAEGPSYTFSYFYFQVSLIRNSLFCLLPKLIDFFSTPTF